MWNSIVWLRIFSQLVVEGFLGTFFCNVYISATATMKCCKFTSQHCDHPIRSIEFALVHNVISMIKNFGTTRKCSFESYRS